MRRYSSEALCIIGTLVFLLSIPCGLLLADDAIEIDLGNNNSSSPRANPVVAPLKNVVSKQEVPAKKTVNAPSRISSEEKASISMISQINISSENNKTTVFISGANLPEPLTDKLSDKKVKIIFPHTSLNIPAKINQKNEVVKAIRSAPHGSAAWVVIDAVGVRDVSSGKNDGGYSIVLTTNNESNEISVPAEKNIIKNTKEVLANTSSEKKMFSRLIDTSLKPVEKGIKIVLTSDGPAKYTIRKLAQPEKLIIRFHGTKLDATEKVKKFNNQNMELQSGGLISMELEQIGPNFSPIAEVILTLIPGTIYQVDRDLNQVVVTLSTPLTTEKSSGKKGNLNQLVSLDVENAGLDVVIKTLASEAGFDVDFVVGGVGGLVNEKFKDVPLKTVLAVLLAPGSYDYEIQGNTLRIGPQAAIKATKSIMPHVTELLSPSGGMAPGQFDTLVRSILKPTNAVATTIDPVRNVLILFGTASDIEDYKKTIKDLKLDENTSSDRITRVVKINYSDPGQLTGILGPYLTPVGRVQVDPRTNNLIIWEVASNMGVLLELIKEIDVKTPQVLIESNIVEVNDEKDLNIGINWNASRAKGDPTFGVTVALPPQNAGAAVGQFIFGTVKSGLDISANLQALETSKKGKVVSRPRIATASGVQAELNTIENVIYTTSSSIAGPGGAIVTSVAYNTLALPIDFRVTPRITDDGRITTIINASITSQSGTAQTGAPPPTTVQTATTTLTTKNGETIVIGGLVREISQDVINGIPILSSIPIIGTLFQEHDRQNKKVELVIFITPTILED